MQPGLAIRKRCIIFQNFIVLAHAGTVFIRLTALGAY